MKKIITVIITFFITVLSNAQAPDSWTEINAVGGNVPASSIMPSRWFSASFSIGNKGYIGTSGFQNDLWEYDPSANLFTKKTPMGWDNRQSAVGFSIGNKGYIGTGISSFGDLGDFWEYDAMTNAWTQKADFAGGPRYSAVGFGIGNKGYLGTGDSSSIFGPYHKNDFWEYDPVTNNWTQKASFAGTPRGVAIGFSIGNKGYIGTGYDGAYRNDFWEYDPSINSWVQKANFGGGLRGYAVSFNVGNKGFVGTGTNNGVLQDDFWEYDPASNAWTQKTDFGGTARTGAAGFSIGTKGYIGTGNDGVLKNDFWEYDPAGNNWTQKSGYTEVVSSGGCSFNIGSKGYWGTGLDGSVKRNTFWQYDPAAGAWIQKANFGGTGRANAAGFSMGGKGYIGTGTDGALRNDFWEYDLSTNTWTQKANFGGVARQSATGFSIGNKGYMGTGFDGTYKNDFWEYDPVTNNWSQKANFGGVGRSEAIGFAIGNKGYLGTGLAGTSTNSSSYKNDFWEYDPALNTWTQKANTSGSKRFNAVGFSIGSKGYMGTGTYWTGDFNYLRDFWEYDPVTNAWILRADFGGLARTGATGFFVADKGYIGVGYQPQTPGGQIQFYDFWEYTPICSAPVATINFSGNTNFCNGDSVFLYANTGYNYQWKKNGVDIAGATSYFYNAKSTGNYTCYLTNSCGAVTSSAISVTVNSLPSAAITPAGPTTFCSGESVVLNVPSGANKTYQWKKGANLISAATLSSYSATTGGNYRAIVTNTVTGCSKTTGSATVVTVNALPAATITPQGPTTFCAGGSVVLAANTGTGLTYKWKKGSNYISGATLSNYTATIGGNYRVQVTNSNGCSKTSALVAVSVPCKEGESVNVGEGESMFDFTVYPNPNSGEFTIKFSTKPSFSIQIEFTDEIGKAVKKFETNDETIVIKESNLAKGIYWLTARNKDEVVIKKINIVK